eukprot:NODE_244_length_13037_cov_0.560442.p3 type:complete len:301 gc:universal NODE_244_length_13037_cov_0.560442:6663-5761(-)
MLSTSQKYEILGIVTKVASVPSIIGSSVILHRFFNSEEALKRNLSQRIIFYMSILDFVCSVMFFIGPWFFDNQYSCTFQGFVIEMTLAAPLWNFAHTTNILLRVIFGVNAEKANRLEPFYHAIAWGIPIVGGIIGISRDSMVPVGGWCWFNSSEIGLRFGSFYAWVFFCVTYNIMVAFSVLLFIRNKQRDSGFKLSKKTMRSAKNQLYYVAALCISFGPSSITRIVQTVTGEEIFWLQIIQAATLPLQGALNCIIYLSIQGVIFKKVNSSKSGNESQSSSASYQKLSHSGTESTRVAEDL